MKERTYENKSRSVSLYNVIHSLFFILPIDSNPSFPHFLPFLFRFSIYLDWKTDDMDTQTSPLPFPPFFNTFHGVSSLLFLDWTFDLFLPPPFSSLALFKPKHHVYRSYFKEEGGWKGWKERWFLRRLKRFSFFHSSSFFFIDILSFKVSV